MEEVGKLKLILAVIILIIAVYVIRNGRGKAAPKEIIEPTGNVSQFHTRDGYIFHSPLD